MARDRNTRALKVGYVKASAALNRAFTVLFCLAILVAAAPLMVVIALVGLVLNGRPVLYSGVRLGKHKQLFRMYKFRTLVPDAQNLIGAEIFSTRLTSNREMLTRSGQFLRDTRLDELPQLFNVLKGDMDILGPRPERPEIYEKFCKDIKGYDRRFIVKPGLIGYSQIFTPHSTPKRIRHRIDNRFLTYRHRYSFEVGLVLAALFMLLLRSIYKIYLGIGDALSNLVNHRSEKRSLKRLEPRRVEVLITNPAAAESSAGIEGTLKDINEEALLVYTTAPVPAAALHLRLVAYVVNWRGREVRKTFSCAGEIYKESRFVPEPYQYGYVFKYTPTSSRNTYLVHQHLLNGSIVHAMRREKKGSSADALRLTPQTRATVADQGRREERAAK